MGIHTEMMSDLGFFFFFLKFILYCSDSKHKEYFILVVYITYKHLKNNSFLKEREQINPIKLVHMLHLTSQDSLYVFPLCRVNQAR